MMTSSFEAFCNRVTAVTAKKGCFLIRKNILFFK
nr:MAG TPA: putative ATP-binding protein [Caudoviricetes sp.]